MSGLPEPGWYEQDPSPESPGRWRKVSDVEASAWERDMGRAPDGRHLVRYVALDGCLVAWSAHHANQALPNGQVIPPRTAVVVVQASG